MKIYSNVFAFTEDMRKMVVEREQLQSEIMGLHAALQQLQTLSENQKSEIQNLQLLVTGKLSDYIYFMFFLLYILVNFNFVLYLNMLHNFMLFFITITV